jgi:hypothetical protein
VPWIIFWWLDILFLHLYVLMRWRWTRRRIILLLAGTIAWWRSRWWGEGVTSIVHVFIFNLPPTGRRPWRRIVFWGGNRGIARRWSSRSIIRGGVVDTKGIVGCQILTSKTVRVRVRICIPRGVRAGEMLLLYGCCPMRAWRRSLRLSLHA